MNSALYREIQDGDKSFETLLVCRSLALNILVNLHNYKNNASTSKMYSFIKRDFFGKGMWIDIDKSIQNCHTCNQHNLQNQSHSYIHMKPPCRQFNTIASI